ncbi:MAG: outer membrane protein assembly factor BamD [Candidatus Zixiibacteriota bacterium]
MSTWRRTAAGNPGHVMRLALALGAALLLSCSAHHVPPTPGSAPEMFTQARSLYEHKKWDKAKIALESVIFNHPGATVVDSAQFLLAMCSYRQKDYVIAADEFRRLRSRYPTSPLVDEADMMRCRSLLLTAPSNSALDQDRTQEAVVQLRLFKDNHPLSPYLPTVDSLVAQADGRLSKRDFKTGVLYHRLGRYEAARIYLQRLIDEFTDSPLVPEALFYIGEGHRRLDSLDRAQEYYEKLIYVYPDHPRTAKARKRVAELARRREQLQAGP